MFKRAGFFSGGTGSQRVCAAATAGEQNARAAQISFNFILHPHITRRAESVRVI